MFMVSSISCPSHASWSSIIPACSINIITVTHWNVFCSEATSSHRTKPGCACGSQQEVWMALNNFGSFFPMPSSRLSQRALHVHSCLYATPQGTQCISSAECHRNNTPVNSRSQLKRSSQFGWKHIMKGSETIATKEKPFWPLAVCLLQGH